MLEDFNTYTNLGSPSYFKELIGLFSKKTVWKTQDLKAHFYNRVIDGQYIFDGGITFLLKMGILNEDIDFSIILNTEYKNLQGIDIEELKLRLTSLILNHKLFEEYFLHIFSPGFIIRDSFNGDIIINNNAFELRYSNLKQLLLSLNFIEKPSGFNYENYVLNKYYHNLIIKNGLPRKAKKLIDLQQLEEQLRLNEMYGREAEEFVLLFEDKRIGKDKKPIQISEIDVCAGFDILSFHDKLDEFPTRLIEVKSYSGNPHFHWSKNEIEKAKEAEENYYIYLVNRDQINEENYSPLIIKNPFYNIFESNDWMKSIESYFLCKI